MKRGYIFVSEQHYQRWRVLELVELGRLSLKEAALKMGVSYRHAKRMRRAVVDEGASALSHGNRGRSPQNKIAPKLAQRILALSEKTYSKFNDSHFAQKLEQREGIKVSRDTVRRLRRGAGIPAKRKRTAPRHHKRRDRKPQEGLMMLWDGSPHHWFGPKEVSLMASIDDATGRLLAARFFPFEGTTGYLWLLQKVITNYGVPLSVYQDRHGSLHRNDKHWSIEEELAGEREPTHVGKALKALEITPIVALTAQAKGRVERLFATLQDRLVAELDLEKIRTIDEANTYLEDHYIEQFNREFAISPRNFEKAWRRLIPRTDLNRLISFYYQSTVGNDNTVRLGGLVIDIPPGPRQRSYCKARVEVRQLLDGSWRVYYRDEIIAEHPSTSLSDQIRALTRKKTRGSDPLDWIYRGASDKATDYVLI